MASGPFSSPRLAHRAVGLLVVLVAGTIAACGGNSPVSVDLTGGRELVVERTAIGDPDAPIQVVHWGNFL